MKLFTLKGELESENKEINISILFIYLLHIKSIDIKMGCLAFTINIYFSTFVLLGFKIQKRGRSKQSPKVAPTL